MSFASTLVLSALFGFVGFMFGAVYQDGRAPLERCLRAEVERLATENHILRTALLCETGEKGTGR